VAGVRIVDFSWVLTGPICTKFLAALGAEAIKVESRARPDLSQRDISWEEPCSSISRWPKPRSRLCPSQS
jgi:crotonobetainyl-CoA:carnitine CoA-transferase CaiB-like acyl-CoA transferase